MDVPFRHAKVFKIYGLFDPVSPIPQTFFSDFMAMLNTFLRLEAERLRLGIYHAAAWPAHGRVCRNFCYMFTFAGPEYDGSDSETEILCSNLARRLCSWIKDELRLVYPQVLGLWCMPLINYLD